MRQGGEEEGLWQKPLAKMAQSEKTLLFARKRREKRERRINHPPPRTAFLDVQSCPHNRQQDCPSVDRPDSDVYCNGGTRNDLPSVGCRKWVEETRRRKTEKKERTGCCDIPSEHLSFYLLRQGSQQTKNRKKTIIQRNVHLIVICWIIIQYIPASFACYIAKGKHS